MIHSADEKPIIVVTGATSKQGRSVATSLQESGSFQVRALSRRSDTPTARTLIDLGVEVVTLPLELGHEKALVQAFRGAKGVFLMTPPIAPPATHEFPLGRQLADAAVEAGIEHIVFSTLENVDKISGGSKYAPHFTDKALIADYIRTLPISHTFIMLSFFYTNLLEYYTPRLEGDKLLVPIYLPEDFQAPFVDPLTATGPIAVEIFSNPGRYNKQTLPIVGDLISPREMLDTFRRVTGRNAEYRNAYTKAGLLQYFPEFANNDLLVRELLGMAEYAVEFGYFGKDRDLTWSRRIDSTALSWEQFLRSTGWQGDRRSYGV
ncbi:NmrA/HSCARG family protein [Labrenzia sp. CE80]|uniref:NmrA/HSCARG family protein n=1 Tax=Labrenzia sp. CE80 TaxID=1788986 RepID=UPI00129C030D|nr:NmrA/HSCARG family protein [Labrenzia sp. CE80]